jgi:hypothetical protein
LQKKGLLCWEGFNLLKVPLEIFLLRSLRDRKGGEQHGSKKESSSKEGSGKEGRKEEITTRLKVF